MTDPAPPPVVLTKGQSGRISLAKDAPDTEITCTLTWRGRERGGSDLDLFAMYVPADEVSAEPGPTTAAVDFRHPGALDAAPFLRHSGDSTAAGTESVVLRNPAAHGYVLLCVYSAVSNGAGSLHSYRAEITVTDHAGQSVTCALANDSAHSYWCAFALIDLTDPRGVRIRNVESYSKRGGERSPLLYADGTFAMDKGPLRFKGVLGWLTRNSKPLTT
ncbi:TerD family protein [Kitasatospora sp. NA04385]|uniref:TerD family protein n=1 Tax=Kitasatospora sp. NA04385 TaxID=2742135 RepID=UPI00159101A4|nr:TerD family protein [Kitasatospora sp. NA04385]QKW23251.1 TerD family protein [Kitasatospora sp. NA04385]